MRRRNRFDYDYAYDYYFVGFDTVNFDELDDCQAYGCIGVVMLTKWF